MYHGSDTMYRKYCKEKGELKKGKRTDGAALKPGTAVFVWNGSRYSHVGLYIGDGTVIEAMGTVSGVTTTKVTAGKWTHWGMLAGVDYAGLGIIPMEKSKNKKTFSMVFLKASTLNTMKTAMSSLPVPISKV